MKLVEDAQKIKSKTQNFADRAAKILTFVALDGGFSTLAVWPVLGFSFVLYQTDNRRKSRRYRQFMVGHLLPFRQKWMVERFIYIDHMDPVKLNECENVDV